VKKNITGLKFGGEKIYIKRGEILYVILVYDIMLDKEENGARVLRRIFKICKKYLHHIQNSVFEGEVTQGHLISLKMEINNFIRPDKDSVIIFENQNKKWLHKELLGKQEDKTSNIL